MDAAASNGVALLVTTFCYAEPEDRQQFGRFEEIVQRHKGELLPVFLHCSREEAIRRVGNPDRVERRKMTSSESLIDAVAPVLRNEAQMFGPRSAVS